MNNIQLPSDVEIKRIPRAASHVNDLFQAYNIEEDDDSSDDAVLDITVPIVEMVFEDSDEEESEAVLGNGSELPLVESAKGNGYSQYDESAGNLEEGQDLSETSSNSLGVKNNSSTSQVEHSHAYRCELCGAGFRVKHSITKHRRVVHGLHQFSCMFCNSSYPMKRELLTHITSHRGPHGFKCQVCNKVRPSYVSIQRHIKTHAAKRIPCTKCGACFKTKWELRSHEIQHQTDRQFDCSTCGIIFNSPSKLREHQISLHSTKDRPYKCDVCGKDFSAQGNLTNHRRLHFDKKPFKCQYCSLTFYTNSARKKHVPVHERERKKPYQCEICHKKYTSTTSLAVHRLKFHSGGRIYHCHYCKLKFKSKSAISEHVAEHAAERPYSCSHCLCRYKNKRELRRHQREKEHYDTPPTHYQTRLPLSKSVDQSTGDDDDDDSDYGEWEMPEPEVCIREASDDDQQSP